VKAQDKGEDKGAKKQNGKNNNSGIDANKQPPYVAPFDPKTQLEGYKRGQIAAERRQQELQDAEMQAEKQRKFKALPLPGGGQVHNNLYAKTKAAEAKEKRSRKRRGKGGPGKPRGPQRMDAADLFRALDAGRRGVGGMYVEEQEQGQEAAPAISEEEIQRRKEARKAKRMKQKMEQDQKGILSLQEGIARMEMKLGKKKRGGEGGEGKGEDKGEGGGESDNYLDAIESAGRRMKIGGGDGDDSSSSSSSSEGGRPNTFLTGTNIADEYGSDDSGDDSCSSASSVSSGEDKGGRLNISVPKASAAPEGERGLGRARRGAKRSDEQKVSEQDVHLLPIS